MKKILALFLLFTLSSSLLAKNEVTIAIEDNDFAPYTFGKKSKLILNP